jgi:hypothetical protein
MDITCDEFERASPLLLSAAGPLAQRILDSDKRDMSDSVRFFRLCQANFPRQPNPGCKYAKAHLTLGHELASRQYNYSSTRVGLAQ